MGAKWRCLFALDEQRKREIFKEKGEEKFWGGERKKRRKGKKNRQAKKKKDVQFLETHRFLYIDRYISTYIEWEQEEREFYKKKKKDLVEIWGLRFLFCVVFSSLVFLFLFWFVEYFFFALFLDMLELMFLKRRRRKRF